jgi:hypothetical protein
MTASDLRYQLVLDNMARVAANRGNLPSLATVTDGQTAVADSLTFDAKTTLDFLKGFTSEVLNGSGIRSPNLTWTMDPTHTADQIRALQLAFLWVLGTPPPTNGPGQQKTLEESLLYNFQVYCNLKQLVDSGPWFQIGCKKDVPRGACYVGHYCDTYVWIAPGGLCGLSEFTLILSDIATTDPASLTPPATVDFSGTTGIDLDNKDGNDGGHYSKLKKAIPFIIDYNCAPVRHAPSNCHEFSAPPQRIVFLQPIVLFGGKVDLGPESQWADLEFNRVNPCYAEKGNVRPFINIEKAPAGPVISPYPSAVPESYRLYFNR